MRRASTTVTASPPPPLSLFVSLHLLLLLLLSSSPAAVHAALPPPTYLDQVCKPPTLHAGDVVPPCTSVEVTETLCIPNGTAPLYLEAHAQCMCKGSFFAEWTGCRACLTLHGLLSDRERDFYQSVASTASSSLCGFLATTESGVPTATFKAIFSSVEAGMPEAARPTTTGDGWWGPGTGTGPGTGGGGGPGGGPHDKFPGSTEVSLYYTPTGPQGPGAITGSAALATATGLEFATGRPSFNVAPSGSTTGGAASTASARSGGAGGGGGGGGGSAAASATGAAAPGSGAAAGLGPLRSGFVVGLTGLVSLAVSMP